MHTPIIRPWPPLDRKRRALQPLPLEILVPQHVGIRPAPLRQLGQAQHETPGPRPPHVEQPAQEPRLADALVPRPQVARVQPHVQVVEVGQRHQRVAQLLPGVVRHGERGAGAAGEDGGGACVVAVAVRVGGRVVDLGDQIGDADADLDGPDGVLVGVGAIGVEGEEVDCGARVGEDEGGVGVEGG